MRLRLQPPSNFGVVENKDSSGKRFSWQLPITEYGSWDQNIVADVRKL